MDKIEKGVKPKVSKKQKYNLNKEKAIFQKLKACDKQLKKFKKGSNYIFELSTAGFEAFREILLMNIRTSTNGRQSRHYEHEVQTDHSNNITQDVIRLRSWMALYPALAQGRTGSLSATINMYRTTSNILQQMM